MAVGGEPAACAVKDDQGVLAAAEETAAAVEAAPETNWVEMPLSNLRWILGRTRGSDPVPTLEGHGIYTEEDLERKDADGLIRRLIATLQAEEDDFFEFQAWVREVYLRNGRVMVPEDTLGPKDELQRALDEDWGDGLVLDDDDDSADDAVSVDGDADPDGELI